MKALLLAAGLGERLRPITDKVPKCLVPIGGKPLLGYWLDLLTKAGVSEFYINLHYHAQVVRDFVSDSGYATKVEFLEEETLLGTGGTLKKNADLFLNESTYIAHADNLCLTDFKAFIGVHKSRPEKAAITMMTFNPPDPRTCGVVELDSQNIVTAFHEKVENPPTNMANGAVFMMEPEVVQYAKDLDKEHFEISLDIIPNFTGRILAWQNDEYHLDIGSPQTYKQAQDENERVQSLYNQYMGNI